MMALLASKSLYEAGRLVHAWQPPTRHVEYPSPTVQNRKQERLKNHHDDCKVNFGVAMPRCGCSGLVIQFVIIIPLVPRTTECIYILHTSLSGLV